MSSCTARTARTALTLVSIALSTMMSGTLSAQGSATASIDVAASIINPISVAVTHPVDFGRMLAGTNKTLASNAPTSGRIEVQGQNGSAVSVTVTMPSLLAGTGGGTIAASSWSYMVSPAATLAGAISVPFNGGTPTVVAATLGLGTGVVKLYLGLGGTVNLTTATVGNYTGTGQVTAAYTDL